MPARQTISPARTEKETFFTALFLCSLLGTVRCLHLQHRLARMRFTLVYDKLNITTNHHAAELRLVGVLNIHGADALALAQDGATIRHGHNLVGAYG